MYNQSEIRGDNAKENIQWICESGRNLVQQNITRYSSADSSKQSHQHYSNHSVVAVMRRTSTKQRTIERIRGRGQEVDYCESCKANSEEGEIPEIHAIESLTRDI
jgi:hypothetical protein